MKKIFQSDQHKRHQHTKQRRSLRIRRKRTTKIRDARVAGNVVLQLRDRRESRTQNYKRTASQKISHKHHLLPRDFRLLGDNTNNVIESIEQLKGYREYDNVTVNLSAIEEIDHGAISILLSAVHELSVFNVSVSGNLPTDKKCQDIFNQSGFMSHVNLITGKRKEPVENKNLLVKIGQGKAENRKIGKAIESSMEYLTGEKQHYSPLYTLILEMSGNAVEHAYVYESQRHWLLGISYDDANRKIFFTFADNGKGILKSIHRKFGDRVLEIGNDNGTILSNVFDRKYGSSTKELNRNWGLPEIKRIYGKGEISDLIVITNNVLLDFSKNTSIDLGSEFFGTLYHWSFDLNNISTWKQQNIQ